MRDYQALPLGVAGRRFGQQCQCALDIADLDESGGDGETQPVVCGGPCGNVPELGDILRREIYHFPGREQAGNAFDGYGVAGVFRLRPAQQDIGINKNAHPRAS